MNNYSKQREEILEILKNNPIHPTAEQIYKIVVEKGLKISKSTVYRNINILSNQGIIQKISILNGIDRYDYIHKEHQHVICQLCKEVFDFYHDFKIDDISESFKSQVKQEIDIQSLVIYGICEKCKSQEKHVKEE